MTAVLETIMEKPANANEVAMLVTPSRTALHPPAERYEKYVQLLASTKSILQGHFELQDLQHSNHFLKFARIAAHEQYASEMADDIHELLGEIRPTRVFGPVHAGGLLVPAMSRKYGVKPGYFDISDVHFRPTNVRYGYELTEGDRVLLVNDMNATGTSIRYMAQLVRGFGYCTQVVGIAVFATRGEAGLNTLEDMAKRMQIPSTALVHLNMPAYPAKSCQLCSTSTPRNIFSMSLNS